MKLNRTHLILLFTSLALVIVLVIQVNWMFQSAETKSQIFNEKAGMVLARTAQAYSEQKEGIPKGHEKRKLDSLFKYYMSQYNIKLGYYFEFNPGRVQANGGLGGLQWSNDKEGCCVKTCLPGNAMSRNANELKLVFPDSDEFLLDEIGLPFISSLLLLILVIYLSWTTFTSLLKEKQISEHTTEFLNNMTHEFKTPLTNIALAAKMLEKQPVIGDEKKVKHYSDIILEENEKLRLQVEQVLSMSALERGEIPMQCKDADLHQLITDAIKTIGLQIENKKGELKLRLEAVNSRILADRTHLINVFYNLIDNAVKYSGTKPDILIETSNRDGKLCLAVSDHGIGIDPEHKDRIFDKYYRIPTGDTHEVRGFGLGLAYVKKIVELHGGTIELQSRKGKGTTFNLIFPNA